MVRQWQEMFFAERFSQVHLTHQVPDYAMLAEAYGRVGHRRRGGRAREALEEALDLRADRRRRRPSRAGEQCFPMIPAGAAALDLLEFPDGYETVAA